MSRLHFSLLTATLESVCFLHWKPTFRSLVLNCPLAGGSFQSPEGVFMRVATSGFSLGALDLLLTVWPVCLN